MNFYAFHIGDYVSATRHLSWDEDLAYRRLMDAYYMLEDGLPADKKQIYRLVLAKSKAHREAIDSVLSEFFFLTDCFHHARCDEEIAKAQDKKTKASQSANKRWSNADAMPTHSEGNAPNPNPIKEKNNLTVVPKEIRGTRLPDSFEPDETCHALAEELLLSRPLTQQAFDEFRDYWRAVPGARGVKIDWQATFRNQLRRFANQKGKFNGSNLQTPKPGSYVDGFAKVRAVIAEAKRRENGGDGTAGEADVIELSRLRQSPG